MLFDGAAVATGFEVTGAGEAGDAQPRLQGDAREVGESGGSWSGPGDSGVAGGGAVQLLVVDASVGDWQTLVSGVGPDVRVVLLDSDRDGVQQLAQAVLSVQGPVSAVHVLSHGESGALRLGDRTLDGEQLGRYEAELAAIGGRLEAGADILLYGCEVGSGEQGAAFLSALARATKADVAASTDMTGARGDWDLEAATGTIEAAVAISAQAQKNWDGTLFVGPPELSVVETSEPATPDTPTVSVAPGEVVRYRLVVGIAEGATLGAEVRPQLPAGLRYVNDGTTTIAFVADGGTGGIDSTTLAGAGLDVTGGGVVPGDILTDPVFVVPGANVVDGLGAPVPFEPAPGYVMASGAEPRFLLGDLVNNDVDGNNEFIVIEFNAIVENEAGNNVGTVLPVSFDTYSSGVLQANSNSVALTVAEPQIVDVDKRVVSLSGNQVTFEVTFTNSGSVDAHDVRLFDEFAGATNITFNGAGGVTLLPPGAVNSSDADTLDVGITSLAPGGSVTVRYLATVTDPAQVVPNRDAVVTYTSLSAAGELMTVNTVDGLGAPASDATYTTGERTGNTGDYGGVANDYIDAEGAGLGIVAGVLWDDTLAYNQVIDGAPAENRLAGVTVQITWAGPDNVLGNGDDFAGSTTTDGSGQFAFAPLPAGNYRISVPLTVSDPASGAVGVYFDRGGAAPLDDGVIDLVLGEGELRLNQDFGFVKQNASPTVTAPGAQVIAEEMPLAFSGANQVSVADPDLAEGFNPSPLSHEVALGVTNGTLSVVASGAVVVTGNGTASVQLTGTVADINATLASLTYQGATNYVGADTLTVRIDDRGAVGDADADGVPGEVADDNLFATAAIPITVTDAGDPPTANDDARSTDETTPVSGSAVAPNPTQQAAGDVADTDPDLPGDTLTVCGASVGAGAGPITGGAGVGTQLAGAYGVLVIQADGSYTYTPGAGAIAIAQGQVAQDVFTYTVCDQTNQTSSARITISITGANAPPVANPDTNTAPADASAAATGNAVTATSPGDRADTDPDVGDTVAVQGVQAGTVAGPVAGGVGTAVTGSYGTLVLNADGSYSYVVDSTNPAVVALVAGQALDDVFTYTVNDGHGATATTTLTIHVDPTPAPPPAPPPGPAPDPVPPAPVPAPAPSPEPGAGPKSPPPPIMIPPVPQPDRPQATRAFAADPVPELDPVSPLWFGAPQLKPLAEQADPRLAAVKSSATGTEVAARDDCVPELPVKPKPKAVKRSVLADHATVKPTEFSQQLKDESRRFKPPAKVRMRAPVGRQC